MSKIKVYLFNLLFKNYIDKHIDTIINIKFENQKQDLLKIKSECETALNDCFIVKENINNILNHFDISLDISPNPKYSKSWAVISIQGKNEDFIQFIDDVSDKDIREISEFLRQFNRYKIDCPIGMKEMFRIDKNDILD